VRRGLPPPDLLSVESPWWLASYGLAEAHDDAEFVWVDAEGKGKESGEGHDYRGKEEDERAWEAAAAWHDLPELILTAPQPVFKVVTLRRACTLPSRSRPTPNGYAEIAHSYFAQKTLFRRSVSGRLRRCSIPAVAGGGAPCRSTCTDTRKRRCVWSCRLSATLALGEFSWSASSASPGLHFFDGRVHYAELGRLMPADVPARGIIVALADDNLQRQPSAAPRLHVLSAVEVERQTAYDGPTWLDQAIISKWRPDA
jgi:hypothetical protein